MRRESGMDAVMIAKELGWSDTDCENLRKAAKMHDIGKIGIPDSILNKPARLTDEEYRVMKSHTVQGGEILKGVTLVPLWMDSFGTVLCAYLTGPICGAMVGVTGNILRTLSDPISWAYGLTSIALAAVVGRGLKHNSLDSLLGAMTLPDALCQGSLRL